MMELPHNLLLYGLLLVAVAAGFLLGRRERNGAEKPRNLVLKDYYQGLNFLLSERPEMGVDQFIQSAEVSDQTIDVHLAMASVVRRRGEVDKAIRIHQNLLASPVLNKTNKQLIELELARDYQVAGLLDRAESLLQQIAAKRGLQEQAALELLLDLYEQQRDWQQALTISQRLLSFDESVKPRISHFYCEQVEQLLNFEADKPASLKQAAQLARRAAELAPDEVRSVWLTAQILFQQGKFKQVLRQLHKACQLRGDLVAVFVPLYEQACVGLADSAAYLQFLQDQLARHPHPGLMRALVSHLRSRGEIPDSHALVQQISRAPQLAHLPILLDMLPAHTGLQQMPSAQQADIELQQQAHQQIEKIVSTAQHYQCGNCGFSGHHMLWHCPTCRQWGTFTIPQQTMD